ncbi:MAG TPA: Asp-tRNA(Asn)/Glu-tRNA(Gln) amidotransferase subunit GatC [Methanocorpusculum sp.]|nr:Asp-tRNA(Asn)/Glu-tRNA(Gln) amidotransferase subunit GatC [Methanocorpusculum sp.]
MITEEVVQQVASLADLNIPQANLKAFTDSFNTILEYFNILDTLEIHGTLERPLSNIFREDEIKESLSQDDALKNSHESEDGYIRAPKVT